MRALSCEELVFIFGGLSDEDGFSIRSNNPDPVDGIGVSNFADFFATSHWPRGRKVVKVLKPPHRLKMQLNL